MTWFGWVVLTLEAIGAFHTIGDENKTPTGRVIYVMLAALVMVGLLTIGTGHLG